MKTPSSRIIISNQHAPHPALSAILRRHQQAPFRKPIAEHTAHAFAAAHALVRRRNAPLILDSGCGTGESTQCLAKLHPQHFVIGIDKSAARLSKNPYFAPIPGVARSGARPKRKQAPEHNFLLIRADLIDFWRLALEHNWHIDKHYLLYPNPWPKKHQIKRRFHGHPVFFDMLGLAKMVELRSNWQIYAEEFALAVSFATHQNVTVETIETAPPYLSLFEKKYSESEHRIFRVVAEIDS